MARGKKFSWRSRAMSLRYAVEGVIKFFSTEHNARIHLVATVLVIIISIVFPVSNTEAIALAIVTGLVWSAELFNTAIERMADRISLDRDHAIKYIKDISAAAVLVMAIIAVITAGIIFIPKL